MKKLLLPFILLVIGTIAIAILLNANLKTVTFTTEQPLWDVREDIYLKGNGYGGCDWAGTCSRFVLFENGDFIVTSGALMEERESRTYGTIKPKAFAEIKSDIEGLDIERLTQKGPGTCSHVVDGIEIQYTLQNGTRLNSCGMQFGNDDEARAILSAAWPNIR